MMEGRNNEGQNKQLHEESTFKEEDENIVSLGQRQEPPNQNEIEETKYSRHHFQATRIPQHTLNHDEEPNPESQEDDDSSSQNSELYSGEITLKPGQLGCKHYLRGCQLQCPNKICKGAFYPCRFCHDEIMCEKQTDLKKNHNFDRHAITVVKCSRCDKIQPKSTICISCNVPFAKYYCDICVFYDDLCKEKGIYHCDKCGICKVGGRNTSFHCDVCNCCYKMPVKNSHVCVKERLKQNCGVCLEDLYHSRQSIIFLKCNHNIHQKCLNQYMKQSMKCPICRKSLVDPQSVESYFDQEFRLTPMPEEYRNARVNIFCNDCGLDSIVPFHILGGKCSNCRSYNTTRGKGEIIYVDQATLSNSQTQLQDQETSPAVQLSAQAATMHQENPVEEEKKSELSDQ